MPIKRIPGIGIMKALLVLVLSVYLLPFASIDYAVVEFLGVVRAGETEMRRCSISIVNRIISQTFKSYHGRTSMMEDQTRPHAEGVLCRFSMHTGQH